MRKITKMNKIRTETTPKMVTKTRMQMQMQMQTKTKTKTTRMTEKECYRNRRAARFQTQLLIR